MTDDVPDFVPEEFPDGAPDPDAEPEYVEPDPIEPEPSDPPAQVTHPAIVIEHIHDTSAGVYHIVIASPVTVNGEQVCLADVQDIVFADDDPRWFTSDGARLSDATIATKQRGIVRGSLTQEDADVADAEPSQMPGVGESL